MLKIVTNVTIFLLNFDRKINVKVCKYSCKSENYNYLCKVKMKQ